MSNILKHRFRPSVQLTLPSHYQAIYKKYSMIANDPRVFYENLTIVDHFLTNVEGSVVECGTWRGGMACAMMKLGGSSRNYHFFDSFEGLPDAGEVDGKLASDYQKNVDSPVYYNNCTANYDEFINLIHNQDVPNDNICIYKGWFEDTVQGYSGDPISILRLDGDWYSSTIICLRALWPSVTFGGVIIIDDYDAWEGCARAVHDYLSEIKSISRIDRTPLSHVAFIQKLDNQF